MKCVRRGGVRLRIGVGIWAIGCMGVAGLAGCPSESSPPANKEAQKAASGTYPPPTMQAMTRGVDFAKKVIRIGALNDESGPAAAIGKPYALGKRILAAQVNAGGSGLLPEGWTLELVERDHGYDPGRSEQAYKEIKDQVYFLATSFGTPPTLPLRPFLATDKMVAFPASLSSAMAENEYTPPLGPSYAIEVMRAMDWAVETAGGAQNVKAALVADQTDYGKDGVHGIEKAAAHYGFSIVTQQTIAPGQKDFTAVIAALKKSGATHVVLTVLPSSTGPILGTAAKMKFAPVWMGNTPSWVDVFFAHPQLPPAVFSNFHWATGLAFWGEGRDGMQGFLDAYEKYGKDKGRPDFYILVSYVQGLAQLEIARRAIAQNDGTPEGYLKSLHSLRGYDAGGLIEPFDLGKIPYITSTRTRVLKPDFEKKTWVVTAPYAEPKSL